MERLRPLARPAGVRGGLPRRGRGGRRRHRRRPRRKLSQTGTGFTVSRKSRKCVYHYFGNKTGMQNVGAGTETANITRFYIHSVIQARNLGGATGFDTGNGEKLSSTQAGCLAVA